MAGSLDKAFGDHPFDLKSFFKRPAKYMEAMERALMHKQPNQPTSPLRLLHHMRRNQHRPQVAIAAACHKLLLKKCGIPVWEAAYQCLMTHRGLGSNK